MPGPDDDAELLRVNNAASRGIPSRAAGRTSTLDERRASKHGSTRPGCSGLRRTAGAPARLSLDEGARRSGRRPRGECTWSASIRRLRGRGLGPSSPASVGITPRGSGGLADAAEPTVLLSRADNAAAVGPTEALGFSVCTDTAYAVSTPDRRTRLSGHVFVHRRFTRPGSRQCPAFTCAGRSVHRTGFWSPARTREGGMSFEAQSGWQDNAVAVVGERDLGLALSACGSDNNTAARAATAVRGSSAPGSANAWVRTR